MTPKEINQSIESMKMHLTKVEKINHWVNFLLLIIPLCFCGYISIYEAIINGEIPIMGIFIIIAIFLFLRHKLVSPKLDVYKSELTEEQFKQANQAAATLNEWFVSSNNKEYFSAIKGTGWHMEGIKITAILKNGKLYLNSMVNPSIRSNPHTFGLNKKNKLELIKQYQLILKGENVVESANNEIEKREKEFWEESEWTFKNSMMRIIGYGLSILFIILAIWIISKGEIQGLLLGITILGLCGLYFFFDIKVLKQKKEKKKARL
jgi:heme/copper-type cytochrome/quinol oxidase subunit 4